MKIYLQQDGNQTGPFDESVVRARLHQGALTADTYAWSEGMSDWRPLGEILAAAPVRAQAVPSAAPTPVRATPVSFASTAPPVVTQTTKMPWWGKMLVGCGGLVALAMILLAAVIFYAVRQDQKSHDGSSGTVNTDWAKIDKEMADLRGKGDKERTDLQAEIERDIADDEHFTTTKTNNPDGGTTTTITPKSGTSGGKPITKRVDPDGKVITTTVDADGNTVTRTEDKNGNVSTVTNKPG